MNSKKKGEICKKCGASFGNHGGFVQHVRECKGKEVKPEETKSFNQHQSGMEAINIIKQIFQRLDMQKKFPHDIFLFGYPKFHYENESRFCGVYTTIRPDALMMFLEQECLKAGQIPTPDLWVKDRVFGEIYYNKKWSAEHGIVAHYQTANAPKDQLMNLSQYWTLLWRYLREIPIEKEAVKDGKLESGKVA